MMQIDGALADLRALVARYGALGPGMGPDDRPDRLPDDGRGWDFGVDLMPGTGTPAESAVLVLFGALDRRPSHFHTDAVPEDLDLLLTQRSLALRKHPGQVAFPGGRKDPEDLDHVATALREAQEETGVDPDGVVPLVTLPPLTIPVTGFAVTPVIAHWRRPVEVGVVDPGETAAVVRVPLAVLADPAHRFSVTGPSGYTGPAFAVGGLLVWGFTALLVSWLLELGGWARPWDNADVRDLEDAWRRRHELSSPPSDPDRHRGGTIR